jgi:hypothetical protein
MTRNWRRSFKSSRHPPTKPPILCISMNREGRRKCLRANEKGPRLESRAFSSRQVGATEFEPTTSRTRSKRSFLNYCTLVEELNVARRCEAQTTPSRRRSALIDEAERSSAPFALKIGGGSGIGRDSGSDAGELQHVLTQSCSDIDRLNCYW